jgi:hypothetical protein
VARAVATWNVDLEEAIIAAKGAGGMARIPSKQGRKTPIPHDAEMYKWRHLVENCIQRLKEWRRIATRYDKPDTSFCRKAVTATPGGDSREEPRAAPSRAKFPTAARPA